MKILQNLKGAKALNKKEQQSINGGLGNCGSTHTSCNTDADCCGTCMVEVGQTIGTCRNRIY